MLLRLLGSPLFVEFAREVLGEDGVQLFVFSMCLCGASGPQRFFYASILNYVGHWVCVVHNVHKHRRFEKELGYEFSHGSCNTLKAYHEAHLREVEVAKEWRECHESGRYPYFLSIVFNRVRSAYYFGVFVQTTHHEM